MNKPIKTGGGGGVLVIGPTHTHNSDYIKKTYIKKHSYKLQIEKNTKY